MHEVKNSLNVIYNCASIIKVENDSDEKNKYLNIMLNSIDSMKNLDRDFESYRKTGEITINKSTVNVKSLVLGVVDSYAAEAKKHGIKINTECKLARAYTDSSKLEVAIRNLLSNAIKYADQKKDNKYINVSCISTGSGAKIQITDNGIGMDEKELNRLGEPFYRSKRIEQTGTGLGITIVKKLASMLNWDLVVESKLDVGTTATIKLYHILG